VTSTRRFGRRYLAAAAAAAGAAAVFTGAAHAEDLAKPISTGNANSRPFAITADTSGNLWFTDPGTQSVGKLAPGASPVLYPAEKAGKGITFRPKDEAQANPEVPSSLWFTRTDGQIARMSPSGVVDAGPWSIDAGADLRAITYRGGPSAQTFNTPLWLAASGGAQHRLWTVATGDPATYHYGFGYTPPAQASARDVVVGPDGIIYLTTDGGVEKKDATEPNDPPPVLIQNSPEQAYGIAIEPDNTLWVTHAGGVAHMAPGGAELNGGVDLPPGANPHDITIGPDKAVWFTQSGRNMVGRVKPGEAFRETALPAGCSAPEGIATSGDSLYVTCSGSNQLVKVLPKKTRGSFSLRKRTVTAGARFAVSVRFTNPLSRSRVRVQCKTIKTRGPGAIKKYKDVASRLVTGTSATLLVKIGKPGVYRLRVGFADVGRTTFVQAITVNVKPAGR
jgi:virginiamycin B lyase